MADEEVLAYGPFKKTDASTILYWRAYRRGRKGGFRGTSMVETMDNVFTAPTEERLQELAKELGYGLRRAADPERALGAQDGVEPGMGPAALRP